MFRKDQMTDHIYSNTLVILRTDLRQEFICLTQLNGVFVHLEKSSSKVLSEKFKHKLQVLCDWNLGLFK